MDVQVIETKTKKVIATYPIHMSGQNYVPSHDEYFAQAWKCAVDDRLVSERDRASYEFHVLDS